MKFLSLILVLVALVISSNLQVLGAPDTGSLAKPQITITQVPPAGAGADTQGTIAGAVKNAPAGSKVAIYAYGDTWYFQSYSAIAASSNRFQASIHLGYEYACLLVTPAYSPTVTTDSMPKPGNEVLAVAIAAPTAPGPDTLRFSGYDWSISHSIGKIGPGPNIFAAENAWVGSDGFLHLRIDQKDNTWRCAEIASARSFGYGTYRFTVEGTAAGLDPAVVLGLFTWSNSPDYNHREMDTEFSRWLYANSQNSQFVVQPGTVQGNLHRFELQNGHDVVECSFAWHPDSISFLADTPATATSPSRTLETWTYTGPDIPKPGGEIVDINLWLCNGSNPINLQPVEIVIRKFEFKPM